MIMEDKTEKLRQRKKPVLVQFCPSQIPHGQPWEQNQAPKMQSQQLAA
jgi:hypothetical protein